MKESLRNQKVNSLILKDLNSIFNKKFKSEFEGTLLTVTHVELSNDLSIAQVYMSIMHKKPEEILDKIVSLKSNIKKELGNMISNKIKKIPELKFHWDNSIDRSFAINKVLKDIGGIEDE